MLAGFALLLSPLSPADDPRAGYDVLSYRIDLTVDPRARRIEGSVGVEAKVVASELPGFVLDLAPELELRSVRLADGAPLAFRREGRCVVASFTAPRKAGEHVALVLSYGGTPAEPSSFEGFHWRKSADGSPWIGVACQQSGASAWWPCKDSLFHPEDLPERTSIDLRVPAGLTGVSNGHLVGKEQQGAWDLFRWEHPYPCPTGAISICVGAYAEVARTLEIGGRKLDFLYWVLPEDAAKAKLQFEDVPALLECFSEAFGEYPFPKSKYGLVQTSYLGLGHASCIGYGSSFPKWCEQTGTPDGKADLNRFFDGVLVRESAREWWGNAVRARTPEERWIEEGFAGYAEALYVERVLGAGRLEEFMEALRPLAASRGAWVLHTLRWFVDDDERWWKALREFNLQFRYKCAGSDDFRAVLEKQTGKKWERFFRTFVQGSGQPELSGRVRSERDKVLLEIENRGSDGTQFEVPIVLDWRDGKEQRHERVMLAPGTNKLSFPCKTKPADLDAHGWEHVLGTHSIKVE
jgi:aminopeptidase N